LSGIGFASTPFEIRKLYECCDVTSMHWTFEPRTVSQEEGVVQILGRRLTRHAPSRGAPRPPARCGHDWHGTQVRLLVLPSARRRSACSRSTCSCTASRRVGFGYVSRVCAVQADLLRVVMPCPVHVPSTTMCNHADLLFIIRICMAPTFAPHCRRSTQYITSIGLLNLTRR
jgi:hypothetical protein